ncbi:MAG: helix-turn-helix domain-containing protein [Ruminococcaceae bacterium]|nr:helix-turn-helix domain-containing protein [Oscillospiraceae bacterium]
MKPRLFILSEHSYPELNYRTILQTKGDIKSSLHMHDYYEFLLITSGNVSHFVNGTDITAHKGELFLIRPQDVHQLAIIEDGGEYINMNFSQEQMDGLLLFFEDDALKKEIAESEFPPVRRLDDEKLRHAREKMLQTMYKESVPVTEQTFVMKKRLFEIFANFFVLQKRQEENKNIPEWLSNAVEQMKKKENFSKGISRMVEISGKSVEHLSRTMTKYYGFSPTNYINTLRIDYISSMLVYSTWPIIDIWLDAGFESASYVYRLFKERHGITPQQYRNHSK